MERELKNYLKYYGKKDKVIKKLCKHYYFKKIKYVCKEYENLEKVYIYVPLKLYNDLKDKELKIKSRKEKKKIIIKFIKSVGGDNENR